MAADHLSRDALSSFLQLILGEKEDQTPLRVDLMAALVTNQPDWTSEGWRSGAVYVSSQKAYKSGENRYLRFCRSGDWTPLPPSEGTLCKFVSLSASEDLKHRTIKTYLLGVQILVT